MLCQICALLPKEFLLRNGLLLIITSAAVTSAAIYLILRQGQQEAIDNLVIVSSDSVVRLPNSKLDVIIY